MLKLPTVKLGLLSFNVKMDFLNYPSESCLSVRHMRISPDKKHFKPSPPLRQPIFLQNFPQFFYDKFTYRNFNVTHILDSRFRGNDRMGTRACHSRLDSPRRSLRRSLGRESMIFFVAAFGGLINGFVLCPSSLHL